MFEICSGYAFQFLEDIENPPIQLRAIGVELRDSTDYCWHNKTREAQFLFQYTLSGCGYYFDGKTEHEIPAHTAFFIPLPSGTSYYYKDNGNAWKFVYLLLRGSCIPDYYRKIVSRQTDVFHLSAASSPIRQLENIYQLSLEQKLTDPYRSTALAMDFLAGLVTNSGPNTTLPFLVKQAMQLMEAEFSTLSGIEEVAGRLNVSSSHLSREFMRHTRIGPQEYLTRLRLQHAANLLTKSNRKIEEIAAESGFSSGNYFAKVFKKSLGTSPRDFRNNAETNAHSIVL